MKRKKLVILSHTEHFYNKNDEIVGWGSTINEINFLADYWDEVCHVGCLYNEQAKPSSLPYTKNNIKFIPIPSFGGKRIIDKISIVLIIPKVIFQVIKTVRGASEVQLRLPTSIGLFLLPLFSFFIPRTFTFWVKYAGNWEQENPPFSYRLQRWWLKKNLTKCKVTINGFWKNQDDHCLSFENPCLTEKDVERGNDNINLKNYNQPFVFTFVGRLEESKGVDTIIEAFKNIPVEQISVINFIGNGDKLEFYKNEMKYLKEKCIFHGFMNNNDVHSILIKSHFLLLPSKSEGFPKVIAEAACYGAIPIVSNVGSISHYMNDKNAFLWNISSKYKFHQTINKAIGMEADRLKNMALEGNKMSNSFTFMNYYNKLNCLFKND
jgi:glycosyltransferase involved in cell wall biosynthesis